MTGLSPVPASAVDFARQTDSGAPLLSGQGFAIALLLSVALCWPMLLVSVPLGYSDTMAYLYTGARVVNLAIELTTNAFSAPDPAAEATLAAPAAGGGSGRLLRSFVYSAFLHVGTLVPGGLVTALVTQTAATLMVLFAFVRTWPPTGTALAGAAFLAAFSTLPWFASYAMPDILAAAVVLYYALIAGGFGHVSTPWRILLAGIATFAILAHHGNVPLAAGMLVVTLAALALRRNLSIAAAVLSVGPLVLAAAFNLVASAATLDGPSLAPKRLPILLARSIDDGPATWHLREACPKARYAICRIFPAGVPDDITTFLWSDQGIARLRNVDLDAIRAEEGLILWNTLRAYPVAQLSSFFSNAARQLVSIGTEQVNPLAPADEPGGVAASKDLRAAHPWLARFDVITLVGTLAALALAGVAWARGALPPGAGWGLGVCMAGLVVNALIFGGLSAPVDRYQSRMIWALPALALVYWINARGSAAQKTG